VLTLAVDTWRAVNIWTENVTEVLNRFLLLTHVPPMKQIKTHILNFKKPKTQVPIEYLTLIIIIISCPTNNKINFFR